jgi:hypothetical protein
MYHQSQNMLVPTAAQVDNLIAADPDVELFGPFQANDPNVEVIRTRNCCLVPTAYISLVIDQPHTPKELWTTLKGAISADSLDQECAPVVEFLRACLSRPTQDALSPLALDAAHLPTVVALDPDLISHRRRILYEDFPHFNSAVSQAQANLVSQGIHALTQEVHLGRVENREQKERERNKTFESEYPASYQKLLRFAQVPAGNLLQPVWNQLARAKKADRIRVLTQYLELAKQQLELVHVKLEVTPSLLEKVFNLVFSPPAMVAGFTEYFNTFVLSGEGSKAIRQATLYETLYSGSAAPSAADLELIASTDMKPASDMISYQNVVQKALIFHQCLWGGLHPVTNTLRAYHRILGQKTIDLQQYQLGCGTRDRLLFYPRLQFKLQTELDYWFELASIPNLQAGDLPLLATQQVFHDMRLSLRWEPNMGIQVMESLGLNSLQPPLAPAGRGVPPVRGGPPANDGGGTEPGPENRTITNPTFSAELFNQFRESRIGARSVRERLERAGIELPRSRINDTEPMCLAYHARARCNVNCRRSYDHVPYTAAQYAPLAQLCSEHWPQA